MPLCSFKIIKMSFNKNNLNTKAQESLQVEYFKAQGSFLTPILTVLDREI